jgi:glycosyltransferase involved in cell wall biosynthesis
VSSSSPQAELLSIVVPVYNEVRTVRSVIDRLIAIDLPVAREIIVVNDGSTDGTREVLDGIGIEDSGFGTPEPAAGSRQR